MRMRSRRKTGITNAKINFYTISLTIILEKRDSSNNNCHTNTCIIYLANDG